MRPIRKAVAVSTLATTFACGLAFAQDRYNGPPPNHQRYVRHDDWRKGGQISRNDWKRGRRVDYRKYSRYHLYAPPRGYEWREVDGNFVLAAVATGVIASVIAAAAASQ